ncbi:diguanylate cyclase OS=Castellaniella defragrans OX=75697 GN=HNR28_000804 PE=4 SV=1 [Castellaniella defragrans]
MSSVLFCGETARRLLQSRLAAALVLGGAVFLVCLAGIWTRPLGSTAAIWMANAAMLTFLLRAPASASWLGWTCASVGYVLADWLAGASFARALVLNAVNLVSVGAGYLYYLRLSADVIRLRQPSSVLQLVAASTVASCAAGVAGGLANPFLFGQSVIQGAAIWFGGELANYMVTLPVFLSAPVLRASAWREVSAAMPYGWRAWGAPVAALVASCALSAVLRGPGAVTFQVPALLWCGLVFPVFPTALLTLAAESWTLMTLQDISFTYDQTMVGLFRLGVSLIAAAPIMVSCVMQNRNELFSRMQHMATHDGLTGALDRRAFRHQAGRRVGMGLAHHGVLMIDLDHFKEVNDAHGHASGDTVLVAVAERIRNCLRPSDLFGRLGGEEFAVAIEGMDKAELAAIGERIRSAIVNTPVSLPTDTVVMVSVSIGMAFSSRAGEGALASLLSAADAALYQAKHLGRNQVVPAWRD